MNYILIVFAIWGLSFIIGAKIGEHIKWRRIQREMIVIRELSEQHNIKIL